MLNDLKALALQYQIGLVSSGTVYDLVNEALNSGFSSQSLIDTFIDATPPTCIETGEFWGSKTYEYIGEGI